jgi:hypothetical protein
MWGSDLFGLGRATRIVTESSWASALAYESARARLDLGSYRRSRFQGTAPTVSCGSVRLEIPALDESLFVDMKERADGVGRNPLIARAERGGQNPLMPRLVSAKQTIGEQEIDSPLDRVGNGFVSHD